jgi:ABC-2 type transport system ATP-binding protein
MGRPSSGLRAGELESWRAGELRKAARIMDAIRTENLTRTFGNHRAVDSLTLSIAEGEIFGLVGPDGAGKTTTLRMLAGVLPSTSGGAWVAGVDAVRDPEGVKDQIGYMSQRFGLYADLTVMENIAFYADLYGVPAAELAPRVQRLLAFSGLEPFGRRRAGALSGGMKQKLGLCCALVHTPRVLLLDEPTNGVDPVSRRDFWRILYQLLKERVTILLTTSYLDEAERCARVGLIHGGRLIACDTPAGVRSLVTRVLLEVRCSDNRKAVALLRQAGVGDVTPFGDRIHVAVTESETGRAAVRDALEKGGVTVDSLGVVLPSLEDVFTSALGSESAEPRAAGGPS